MNASHEPEGLADDGANTKSRMRAISELVERTAREQAARPALVAPGREPLAFGELPGLIGAVTVRLRERGIGPDDRVALVVDNGPEAATAFLALACGAACAPLNPAYRESEFDFYLGDLGARAVVVEGKADSPVRSAAQARGIDVLELETTSAAPAGTFSLAGPLGDPVQPEHRPPEATALLLHTSGTTSRPKLVPLTHANLTASAQNVVTSLRLTPEDRCLNVMPLFHIHGLVAALLASLDAGASVACTPGFHPIRIFDWLLQLDPTWYTAVPTMHQAVLARLAAHDEVARSHRLRFARSSSAALSASVSERLEQALGVPVLEAYGMTEAAHQIASNSLPPDERFAGSVGRAGGPEIAILGEDGRLLPAGEQGQVAIRGENVFSGYEANPEATAAAFVDGWFCTGDEGVLDERGYLTLRGRLKEVINRGGEKVAPLEIDERLLAHAAVAEAITFAMPHGRLGEEVAAAVVLAQDRVADEASLQDFVSQTLAPFKVPRRIVFVDEIPKGATGKIQRIGLAERLGLGLATDLAVVEHVPPSTHLERELAQIWADVLGIEEVGIHDDFFALGGDSILGAEAVARVRDLTGQDDLPLISIVRGASVAGMVAELGDSVSPVAGSGAIVINAGGSKRPLFFVHGVDGEVLRFVPLSRRLPRDRPLYGLRARGIDDGRDPATSVEEMGREYLEDIRTIQPSGPYLLGGFCMGASVALEMARTLVAAGEDVDLLLVDPRFARPDELRYLLWLVPRRAREGKLAGALLRRLTGWRPGVPTAAPGAPAPQMLEAAREAYTATPLDLPAEVIIGSDYYEEYELPSWYVRRLVPGVQRWSDLDIGHHGMHRPPAVDVLAPAVAEALARLDAVHDA